MKLCKRCHTFISHDECYCDPYDVVLENFDDDVEVWYGAHHTEVAESYARDYNECNDYPMMNTLSKTIVLKITRQCDGVVERLTVYAEPSINYHIYKKVEDENT